MEEGTESTCLHFMHWLWETWCCCSSKSKSWGLAEGQIVSWEWSSAGCSEDAGCGDSPAPWSCLPTPGTKNTTSISPTAHTTTLNITSLYCNQTPLPFIATQLHFPLLQSNSKRTKKVIRKPQRTAFNGAQQTYTNTTPFSVSNTQIIFILQGVK